MLNFGGSGVKFGLNVRGGDAKKAQQKNVFGDESDEEDGGPKTADEVVRMQLDMQRRRVEEQMEKKEKEVLARDPSAYDYDEVYDHIKQQDVKYQEQKQLKQSIRGKPKYVDKLIQEAKKRKVQNDLWYEKKLQREQEAEKDVYGESEKFVTPTYKKHLEELKKFEEQQRKEEERNAVTAQGMKGFYSNLLGFAGPKDPAVKSEAVKSDAPEEAEDAAAQQQQEIKGQQEQHQHEEGAEPPRKKHETSINLENAVGLRDPDAEAKRLKELQELNQSKIDEDKISEAKRRYLERKKQGL